MMNRPVASVAILAPLFVIALAVFVWRDGGAVQGHQSATVEQIAVISAQGYWRAQVVLDSTGETVLLAKAVLPVTLASGDQICLTLRKPKLRAMRYIRTIRENCL